MAAPSACGKWRPALRPLPLDCSQSPSIFDAVAQASCKFRVNMRLQHVARRVPQICSTRAWNISKGTIPATPPAIETCGLGRQFQPCLDQVNGLKIRLKSVEVGLDEAPRYTAWYGLANLGLNRKERLAYKQSDLGSVPNAPQDPTDQSWPSGRVAKPAFSVRRHGP